MEFGDPRLPERFWAKVSPVPNTGCWMWTGYCTPLGYGKAWRHPRVWLAHRLAYHALVGAIPDGLELDHLCRAPGCVNPIHLEPVTHRENCLRGTGFSAANARKTHCIHGHEFSPTNTLRKKGGRRLCRICRRACTARWRHAHREDLNARRRAAHAERLTKRAECVDT